MNGKSDTTAEVPLSVPNFSQHKLLPTIAQDVETDQVLMLAYMNEESFAETVRTGQAVYFSRSRNRLWRKGEESGHVQTVEQIFVDCDGDTILLKVRQRGPACHEGFRTCFFREWRQGTLMTHGRPLVDPRTVYKGDEIRGS